MEYPYPTLIAFASGSLGAFLGATVAVTRTLRRWENKGLMRLLEVIAK
jgi:hypothetical protein